MSWMYVLKSSRLYGFYLHGTTPVRSFPISTELWPGNLARGHQLLRGGLIVNEQYIPGHEIMNCLEKTNGFLPNVIARIHGFEWLRDLKEVGQNIARKTARHMLSHWIYHNHSWTQRSWRSPSWEPEIMGTRLCNWLHLYDFFGASADEDFRDVFFTSMYRQSKHLAQITPFIEDPQKRFIALKALILMGLLGILEGDIVSLLKDFESTLQQMMSADGAHTSGSPILQCLLLRDLIDIRSSLRQTEHDEPPFITAAIYQITPVVRFFRHGDGTLSHFKGDINETQMGLAPDILNPAFVDMVLSIADVKGRPPNCLQHMGYERAMNKSGLVMLNTRVRRVLHSPCDVEPGLPILDFEWSLGPQRIIELADIVIQQEGQQWLQLNAQDGHFTRKRHNRSEGIILNTDFDQRVEDRIYHHQRQIFLSAQSQDLRVQDTLTFSKEALVAVRLFLNQTLDVQNATSDTKHITLCQKNSSQKNIKKTQKKWILLYGDCDQHILIPSEQNSQLSVLFMKKLAPNTPWSFKWAIRAQDAEV